MQTTKKKKKPTGLLTAEVKRLRRDVDLLRIAQRLDDLEARVSRLEFIEER